MRVDWQPLSEPPGLHPSELECQCRDRVEDDFLLHVTEGSIGIEHTACGKPLGEELAYPEDWSTTEGIPVSVHFVDLGMSPSTPNGPAEHNGYWWEIVPRNPGLAGGESE